MKLKDPTRTRRLLDERGQHTIEDIAKAVPMSINTVSKLFRGQPVRYDTIQKLARYLETNEEDIAEIASS